MMRRERFRLGLPPSDLTIYKMILTQCVVCATDLGLTLGKKCGRCSTRYCGAACQEQHWKEGGHDQLCKKIKKAGGAEQYNANKKYAAAATVAEKACAEDTKGQTCYICTEGIKRRTGEGLVRGCSCRGTAGFAHVSCLAEQAKILVAEGLENNLGSKAKEMRWGRWHTCSLCEQDYHGVVHCALAWACWKTYLGRPESERARIAAMTELGIGLYAARHYEDALSVQKADFATLQRIGASAYSILDLQSNLANTYEALGRTEAALQMKRDVYSGRLKLNGEENRQTLIAANNFANSFGQLQRFKEVKALMRKTIPVAQRNFGEGTELTLQLRVNYTAALYMDDGATLDELREAVSTLEEIERIARRVLGGGHPTAVRMVRSLQQARAVLTLRVGPGGA
jgi:hypothetical protein